MQVLCKTAHRSLSLMTGLATHNPHHLFENEWDTSVSLLLNRNLFDVSSGEGGHLDDQLHALPECENQLLLVVRAHIPCIQGLCNVFASVGPVIGIVGMPGIFISGKSGPT